MVGHAIWDPVWFTVIKFLLAWLKDMDINISGLNGMDPENSNIKKSQIIPIAIYSVVFV
jgi:hypothetical protein